MKRFHFILSATAWGVVLVLANPRPAHAYLDPSVAILFFQGLVASAISFLFFGRRYIAMFTQRFLKKAPPAKVAPSEPEQS